MNLTLALIGLVLAIIGFAVSGGSFAAAVACVGAIIFGIFLHAEFWSR